MKKKMNRVVTVVVEAAWILCMASAGNVLATTDTSAATAPLDRLTDILFSIVSGLGVIALIFGVVQLALSFKGHDPQQKMQAAIAIAGGILLIAIKPIVSTIKG